MNQRSTNTTSAPVLAFRTVTYCTENEETPSKGLTELRFASHTSSVAPRNMCSTELDSVQLVPAMTRA